MLILITGESNLVRAVIYQETKSKMPQYQVAADHGFYGGCKDTQASTWKLCTWLPVDAIHRRFTRTHCAQNLTFASPL